MRLIDADKLYTIEARRQYGCAEIHGIQPRSMYKDGYEDGWQNAFKAIEKGMPTVDAVPVVRCHECKHHFYVEALSEYWCRRNGASMSCTALFEVEENGFCMWGDKNG